MNEPHPDLDLARRAAAGENAAWREIYDATRGRIFALLVWHLGDRDEALDVLQDTYVAAVRGIGAYRGGGTLESWIAGIALRRARDWKRRFLKRRKQTDPIEDHPSLGEDLPQPDPLERRRLREALTGLPERQRKALLLHEWMGYSFREIAGVLGTSEATARVHCFRAREAVRARLTDSPGIPVAIRMQEQES